MHFISSAMASFCLETTVEDAMQTVRDAGFDSLDFPLSVYSRPQDAPLRGDDWRQWARGVRRTADRIGLPITQAHASWEQAIPDDLHYESPYEIYERTMEACAILGCRQLIFHPVLYLHRMPDRSLWPRIHDWNVRWFHELLPLAEKFDIVINLENTFDYRHLQQPGDAPVPYTTAQDMLGLVYGIGSNRVQLCLDTGHAHISGQDVPEMIRAWRGNLATLHLNDNYGLIRPVFEDLHLFPGYGTLEWKPIFDALRDIRFRGVLNIEPVVELARMPRAVRVIQLRAAAQTLQVLAEL